MSPSESQATFLMSTYNAGEFLRSAIDSILAQTDPRWRLVVVDDASTDGSADVVRGYDDPRIRLVALERNEGQTAALNRGLALVETPWVARLDQDDVAAPDRLERQLAYLDAHPDTVLLGSWAAFIDERGARTGEWRPPATPEAVRRGLYLRPCPLVHSAVVYRTDVARSLGGYPVDYVYAQDLALWIAMETVGQVAIVPEVLVSLRHHERQASRAPAALALQLGEALATTEALPPDLARERPTVREWRARRLRLSVERALVAVQAADRQLARRSALDSLRLLRADPLAALLIARDAVRSAFRRASYPFLVRVGPVIPTARPALTDAEVARVAKVFESRWLGQGAVTAEFEQAVSERVGGRPFLATNTGTTAMHLALEAIGVGPGDDVVLPSLTFVATAQAVVAAGARPVLCDVDAATLNVDVDCLERAVTPRTRAVVPVHYRGLPLELDEILAWAGERGIRVVEDAAHAFGSVYRDGTPVGGKGDVTCFSFDPIKNVTTGEGGGIVFSDMDERDRAARMAALGIDTTAWGRLETRRPWAYDVTQDGFRYHMPNFCAAIGLAQLDGYEDRRGRKQAVLARYQEAFRGLPTLELREMPVERCFPFLALVLVEDRDGFMGHMRERGVGTGVHYIPSHRFSRFSGCAAGTLEVTEYVADRICSLPLLGDQTDEELELVVESVRSFVPAAAPVN